MAENRVILVIRRDKEYWIYNHIHIHKKPIEVGQLIDMWNIFFDFQWIDFYLSLRNIASLNYMQCKFDEIHLYSGIEPFKTDNVYKKQLNKNLHKNSIVVAIDEDDWILFSLPDILRKTETEKPFFVWEYYKTIEDSVFYPFGKRFKEEGILGRGRTMTCAWASRGYMFILKRRNHLEIKQHELPLVHFINEALSVKVEHVGSLGFLIKTIKENEDKKKWLRVINKKLEKDIQRDGKYLPQPFQLQYSLYRKTLQQLLESRK